MKQSVLITTFGIILGLNATSVLAADLKGAFDFETTAVLPAGVRNPRFKNLVMFMDQKWGGNGGVEALGAKLNKNVSWRDVIDGQDDAQLKALTEGKVKSLGMSLDGSAGSTTGVVNTYVNVKVPVLAVGVTSKLTMAVAVPVVTVQVNADTGLKRTADGQALINDITKDNPDKGQEAATKLNDAVNTKLKRLGYDPINSYTKTNIGDVKVVGKYQLVSDSDQGLAVKGEVTLPTGTRPNADKALDTPTGDGQTDVGATIIYDRFLNAHKSLRANFYGGYTAQLPDHLDRRLPTSDMDSLSSDKEYMARDLGDVIAAGASLNYEFPFGLTMAGGYSFQRMAPTHFGDGRFAAYRYRLLEANTGQVLHSATLGVGFSTVEMYKNHQFKAPFQVNVAYVRPLAGMNVVKNDFMAFELVLFF